MDKEILINKLKNLIENNVNDFINYILVHEFEILKTYEFYELEDFVKYFFRLYDDNKKIEFIDKINNDDLNVIIVQTLSNDDLKIKYLNKFSDSFFKKEIIISLNSDELKEKYMNFSLSLYDIFDVIKTLKSDDLKLKYINETNENYFKMEIIMSLKSDNLKIKNLDKIINYYDKIDIIETIHDNELKFKYLYMYIQNVNDIDFKVDAILKFDVFKDLSEPVARKFIRYYLSTNKEITYKTLVEQKTKYMILFKRIVLSNSIEIQNIDINSLIEIYNNDTSNNKEIFNKQFDSIENIYLRNNLPPFAKACICFKSIYPELTKEIEGRKVFDFSLESMMAPSLLDINVDKIFKNSIINKIYKNPKDKKFAVIYNDLFRASFKSNNKELKEYLINLENGNNIFNKLFNNEISYNSLTEEEKNSYNIFSNNVSMLYKISKLDKKDVNYNTKLDKINFIKEQFKENKKYGLLDRITRYYLYSYGYTSFEKLKEDVFNQCNIINEKNSKNVDKIYKISEGDLIRSIGSIYKLSGSLNNGNVCKEYLGSYIGSSDSDATPLDTDWSYIRNNDIGLNNKETIGRTPTAFGFGDIYIVIKDIRNKENIQITRDMNNVTKNYKYDPKKLEAFVSNEFSSSVKNHWGIRTGTSTSDIDCIIYNNDNNEKIDALKMELAKNNTYIPVYSLEGNLIYDYSEFNNKRKLVAGIKKYDSYEYFLPSTDDLTLPSICDINGNVIIPGTEEIKKIKKEDNEQFVKYKEKVFNYLKEWIIKNTNSKVVNTNLSLEIRQEEADLINIGSTSRNTNLPNDYDYDFYLRLDKTDLYEFNDNTFKSKIDKLKQKMHIYLSPKEVIASKDNRLRGKKIKIDGLDNEVDIDITFIQKTNRTHYSTDMAIKDRLDLIKNKYSESYDDVIANIVLAKYVLKNANVYKTSKADSKQGGIGGVGIESFILQNNGSFKLACEDFLKNATFNNEMIPFEEFKKKYFIWNLGENLEIVNDYPYNNFINEMSEYGYKKMYNAFKNYINEYNNIENIQNKKI